MAVWLLCCLWQIFACLSSINWTIFYGVRICWYLCVRWCYLFLFVYLFILFFKRLARWVSEVRNKDLTSFLPPYICFLSSIWNAAVNMIAVCCISAAYDRVASSPPFCPAGRFCCKITLCLCALPLLDQVENQRVDFLFKPSCLNFSWNLIEFVD